ncbi:MAG TPA: FkbM family methyltransferase [Allosphingosinicella sp.]|nr:FkbM family methyltransferase [Allosphingosinicella sp.]
MSNGVGKAVGKVFGDRIPHRGLTVDVSNRHVTDRTKARLLFRAYESAEYRFMQRYLPADVDVIELGGSLGVMSCLIRRRLAPDRRLVVVEADPSIVELLRRNLAINDCVEGTVVENVAIAPDGVNHVRFMVGQASNAGRVAVKADAERQLINVAATSLSQLLKRNGTDRFSLVSDIEGAEWDLWRNEPEVLRRASWIVMETHDHPDFGTSDELIASLAADGSFELVDRYGPVIALKSRAQGS